MEGYEVQSLKSGLLNDLSHQSSSKYAHDQEYNQTFKTEFPMPEPPKPNYSSSVYDSSESLFNQYGYSSSFKQHGYITTKSGLTFRSADSTERAIRDLEMKHRREGVRRRATTMVAFLFALAIMMLTVTKNQDEKLMRATSGPESEAVGGQLDSNILVLQIEETQAPPEEEIIEEGKEFMQPFRYFGEAKSARRETDSNFFFHIPRSVSTFD